MKFPLGTKLDVVASKDGTRERLTHVYLRVVERVTGSGRSRRVHRAGFLEATDSYRAVRVPVEISDTDEQGYIPIEAVQRARTQSTEDVAANAGVRVGNVTFDRPTGLDDWPDFGKLWDSGNAEYVFSVGLNVKFLKGLADALGADDRGVRLDFQGVVNRTKAGRRQGIEISTLKPIRVTACVSETPGAEGLLMPIRVADPIASDEPAPAIKKKKVTVK